MRIASEIWPCSSDYRACQDFKKLTISQKVITLVAAIFTAIATFFFMGLGAVVIFREMVAHFVRDQFVEDKITPIVANALPVVVTEPEIKQISKHARTRSRHKSQMVQTKSLESEILPKPLIKKADRGTTVGYDKSLSYEAMSEKELTDHLRGLTGDELIEFWRSENQAFCFRYVEPRTREAMKPRLKIELTTLSIEQFEELLPNLFFWNLIGSIYYADVVSSVLNAEQLGHLTLWFKTHKRDNDPDFDLEGRQNTLRSLIAKIPKDKDYELKVEAICPNATIETEPVIRGKLSPIKLKQHLVRAMTDSVDADKTLPHRNALRVFKKPRAKSWAPIEKKPPPPLEKEPEPYIRVQSDEICKSFFNTWNGTDTNQDAFFWVLDNEAGEKAQKFVNQFTLRTNDLDDYKILEKMSDKQLAYYVSQLGGKALIKLLEVERYAAGTVYTGLREHNRMRRRLKIELETLTLSQFTQWMPLEAFWQLITGLEAIKAVNALQTEHFRKMAEWISDLKKEPKESKKLKALNPKSVDPNKDLAHLEFLFCKLISHLLSETAEEKIQLGLKFKAIASIATKDMRETMGKNIIRLNKTDRDIISKLLSQASQTSLH